jgi:hypothetical protein
MPQNEGNSNRQTASTPPAMPRWVKVFGIIAVIVVVFFVLMLFIGGGQHGPGRHLPSGGAAPYPLPVVREVHQR